MLSLKDPDDDDEEEDIVPPARTNHTPNSNHHQQQQQDEGQKCMIDMLTTIYHAARARAPRLRKSNLWFDMITANERLEDEFGRELFKEVKWMNQIHPYVDILLHNIAIGAFGRDCFVHKSHLEGMPMIGAYVEYVEAIVEFVWKQLLLTLDRKSFPVYDETGDAPITHEEAQKLISPAHLTISELSDVVLSGSRSSPKSPGDRVQGDESSGVIARTRVPAKLANMLPDAPSQSVHKSDPAPPPPPSSQSNNSNEKKKGPKSD